MSIPLANQVLDLEIGMLKAQKSWLDRVHEIKQEMEPEEFRQLAREMLLIRDFDLEYQELKQKIEHKQKELHFARQSAN